MVQEEAVCNGEEWRSVMGYEGVYEVSNLGNVRRVQTRFGNPCSKLLRGARISSGYYAVSLNLYGKHRTKTVHSLVAESFLGARPPRHEVDHIDGNKDNNRLENLRYVPQFENFCNAVRHGKARMKLTPDDVRAIRAQKGRIKQIDLARQYGVDPSSISHIMNDTRRYQPFNR